MTVLNADRHLLRMFLHDLVGVKAPDISKLTILEQCYPGEPEPAEQELERRGIPDGWIFDDDGWCVFIESKVIAKLTADQINRHRQTAKRRGFHSITAVAITPQLSSRFDDMVLLEWRSIYAWARQHQGTSAWASHLTDYLEIAEAKLVDGEQLREGSLTCFTGIPFGTDRPFTYLEGKRILGLTLEELRKNRDLRKQLGMNPEGKGRPAITGRHESAVWDFLSLAGTEDAEAFTHYPHLTLGLSLEFLDAMVTVPHAVNATMRNNLKNLGEEGFRGLLEKVIENLKPVFRKCKGAVPLFRGVQRRYPTQRSKPFLDARIEFDLRTAVPGSGGPKAQPRWLSAAYGSFVKKENSNYQIQLGVMFPYSRCPELAGQDALDLIVESWLACKPLTDLTKPRE